MLSFILSEFHINSSDEVMYMIKGEMSLHYRTPEGREEVAVIPEGSVIYTPAGTPHSRRFPSDAFALILARKRREGEIDRFNNGTKEKSIFTMSTGPARNRSRWVRLLDILSNAAGGRFAVLPSGPENNLRSIHIAGDYVSARGIEVNCGGQYPVGKRSFRVVLQQALMPFGAQEKFYLHGKSITGDQAASGVDSQLYSPIKA